MTKKRQLSEGSNYLKWATIVFIIILLYFIVPVILYFIKIELPSFVKFSNEYFNFIVMTFPILLVLVVALAILLFLEVMQRTEKKDSDKVNNLILYCGVCLTLILVLSSIPQLNNLKAQGNADFLLRTMDNFYKNEANKRINMYLDDNFDGPSNESIVNRLLDTTKIKRTSNDYLMNKGKAPAIDDQFVIDEWALDDYLLVFDYLGKLEKAGVIDLCQIDRTFGWYISRAWKSWEIRRYIQQYRKKKDPDLYDDFISLANEIVKLQDTGKINEIVKIVGNGVEFKIKERQGFFHTEEYIDHFGKIYSFKMNENVKYDVDDVKFECMTIDEVTKEILSKLSGNN